MANSSKPLERRSWPRSSTTCVKRRWSTFGDDFNWGWTQVQLKRTLVSKRFLIFSHTKIMRAVFSAGARENSPPRPSLHSESVEM